MNNVKTIREGTTMPYSIRFCEGEPSFDRLPVLKLRCPASVSINDRIFAQAQLGLCSEGFFARMWAFETPPAPDSELNLKLCGPAGELSARVTAAGESGLFRGGEDCSDALTAYRISGEDLQGEYWGAVVLIPLEIFCSALGINPPFDATMITGNVYKRNPGISAAFEGEGELLLG